MEPCVLAICEAVCKTHPVKLSILVKEVYNYTHMYMYHCTFPSFQWDRYTYTQVDALQQ